MVHPQREEPPMKGHAAAVVLGHLAQAADQGCGQRPVGGLRGGREGGHEADDLRQQGRGSPQPALQVAQQGLAPVDAADAVEGGGGAMQFVGLLT